jgi:hypothetical protein
MEMILPSADRVLTWGNMVQGRERRVRRQLLGSSVLKFERHCNRLSINVAP